MARRGLTVVKAGDTNAINEKLEEIDGAIQSLSDKGTLPFASVEPPTDAANRVYATPDSATATKGKAAFRALVANDLPSIPDAKLTSNVALLNRASQNFTGDPQLFAGKVGIGPAAPGEKLETNGSLYVNAEGQGVIVDAASNKRVGLMKESGFNPELRYLNSIALLFRCITSGTLKGATTSVIPLALDTVGNVAIGSAGSFGGAAICLFLAPATTAPTSNPASGFILYVDPADSKLKARGSTGTVTTLANP